jgi:hypothetical protein
MQVLVLKRYQWHPYLSEWLSVSQHGNIYLWGNVPKMKWSAFAAEFEEIDENVEYIEKETEFDQVSGMQWYRQLPVNLYLGRQRRS